MATELYAKIKGNSKFASQRESADLNGEYPFPIEINFEGDDYVVRGGPGGRYRMKDIILFGKSNGEMVKLKG